MIINFTVLISDPARTKRLVCLLAPSCHDNGQFQGLWIPFFFVVGWGGVGCIRRTVVCRCI